MKIYSYLKLFRIAESILISGTTGMALLMAGITDITIIMNVLLTLLCGTSGIMAWNDTLDIFEDSIAHPERPIISGQISILQARIAGTILLITGLVVGYLTAPLLFVLGIGGATVGILYSFTSKSHFLLIAPMKNIVVISITAIFLILLPTAFEKRPDSLYNMFVLSLLIILFGYEVLKDIRDIEGDRRAGYRTLPVLKGIKFSAYVAIFSFIASCLLMAGVFFFNSYEIEGWISFLTTFVVTLPFTYLLKQPTPETSDKTRVLSVGVLLISLGIIGGLVFLRNTKVFV